MAIPRAERLLNLHILLLGSRRFLSKDDIRRACYAEHPLTAAGDEAFERAFERDKDSLRAIGAVIEVGSADAYFDDEMGYRIPTEQTSLPELTFSAAESAALGIAAQVWQDATMAKATGRALAKLQAQGIEIDRGRLDVIAPAIPADEAAFEPLWDAIQKRRQVVFSYHRAAEPESTQRRVQPWGMVRYSSRWYVVGHDVDRGAPRVFRLSRIDGRVRPTGKSGAYEVPRDADVRGLARAQESSAAVQADVWVLRGAGHELRRSAVSVTPVEDVPYDGAWDLVTLTGPADQLADLVLAHGPDAVVQRPESLRSTVIARLDAALEEVQP